MLEARLRLSWRNSSTSTVPPSPGSCQSVGCWTEKPELRRYAIFGGNERDMKHMLTVADWGPQSRAAGPSWGPAGLRADITHGFMSARLSAKLTRQSGARLFP